MDISILNHIWEYQIQQLAPNTVLITILIAFAALVLTRFAFGLARTVFNLFTLAMILVLAVGGLYFYLQYFNIQ